MTALTELPGPLRVAVVLLAAEAVLTIGLAGFLGYQALVAEPTNRGDALAVAGFVVVIGATLAGLAAALLRRKPRARAPAIVLQLLAVMFAYALVTSGQLWLGIPCAALGIVVASLLFAPSTGQALTPTPSATS